MKAIHVNWTAPFFAKNTDEHYELSDYQLLYTILSALRWKHHNGPIKLYTDSVGMSYYKQQGILHVYDEVNILALNSLDGINAGEFWTSGKVHALEHETEPFVFVDQDFIIRSKIEDRFYQTDLTVAHWEIPRGETYCGSKEEWNRKIRHVKFPLDYDLDAYSPNTCFVCYNNLDVVKEYVDWHKKLINTSDKNLPGWFWLVADQGILGHLIRQKKLNVQTLTDRVYVPYSNFYPTKEIATEFLKGNPHQWHLPLEFDKTKEQLEWEHIWLAKIVSRDNPEVIHQESQRYFDEIWALGGKNYLYHYRFSKYWNKEKHGK